MNEQDLALLLTLKKTGNITHAANLLFTTQSACSKRIYTLEQELGETLILRSKKGIQFTPQGEIVLAHAQKVADTLAQMRRQLDAQKGFVCGTLNLGISLNYALFILPSILGAFRQKYPHVQINTTTDQSRNLYLKVLDGAIDVAILRGEYNWKGNKIMLKRENLCAIALNSFTLEDLATTKLPYIGRKTDQNFEREIAQWLRENNIHTNNQCLNVDNITTCVEMVKNGIGWAIVPEICLAEFKGYKMPLRFANGEPFVRSTYLFYGDNYQELPQVKAFIEEIRKVE